MPIKLNYRLSYVKIHEDLSKGMRSKINYDNAFGLHGPCQIEVPYKGVFGIFLDEFLSPFYLFQVSSINLNIGRKCNTLDD